MVMGVCVCVHSEIHQNAEPHLGTECNLQWHAHSFGPLLFEARQTPESTGPHHKQHVPQTTPEQTRS